MPKKISIEIDGVTYVARRADDTLNAEMVDLRPAG